MLSVVQRTRRRRRPASASTDVLFKIALKCPLYMMLPLSHVNRAFQRAVRRLLLERARGKNIGTKTDRSVIGHEDAGCATLDPERSGAGRRQTHIQQTVQALFADGRRRGLDVVVTPTGAIKVWVLYPKATPQPSKFSFVSGTVARYCLHFSLATLPSHIDLFMSAIALGYRLPLFPFRVMFCGTKKLSDRRRLCERILVCPALRADLEDLEFVVRIGKPKLLRMLLRHPNTRCVRTKGLYEMVGQHGSLAILKRLPSMERFTMEDWPHPGTVEDRMQAALAKARVHRKVRMVEWIERKGWEPRSPNAKHKTLAPDSSIAGFLCIGQS